VLGRFRNFPLLFVYRGGKNLATHGRDVYRNPRFPAKGNLAKK
jgi:hypothetical protein